MANEGEDSEIRSAKIAAWVAVACTVGTLIFQLWGHFLGVQDRREENRMQHRREALMLALDVIDNVYENTDWHSNTMKMAKPAREWDIAIARKAMNGMIIYCENPEEAVPAFCKAIGLRHLEPVGHDPLAQLMPEEVKFGPEDLALFRNIVCKELKLSPIPYTDTNRVWIFTLPGAGVTARKSSE